MTFPSGAHVVIFKTQFQKSIHFADEAGGKLYHYDLQLKAVINLDCVAGPTIVLPVRSLRNKKEALLLCKMNRFLELRFENHNMGS